MKSEHPRPKHMKREQEHEHEHDAPTDARVRGGVLLRVYIAQKDGSYAPDRALGVLTAETQAEDLQRRIKDSLTGKALSMSAETMKYLLSCVSDGRMSVIADADKKGVPFIVAIVCDLLFNVCRWRVAIGPQPRTPMHMDPGALALLCRTLRVNGKCNVVVQVSAQIAPAFASGKQGKPASAAVKAPQPAAGSSAGMATSGHRDGQRNHSGHGSRSDASAAAVSTAATSPWARPTPAPRSK